MQSPQSHAPAITFLPGTREAEPCTCRVPDECDCWCMYIQLQSRRLNAGALLLPWGVHMYVPAYTLCPVEGLAR